MTLTNRRAVALITLAAAAQLTVQNVICHKLAVDIFLYFQVVHVFFKVASLYFKYTYIVSNVMDSQVTFITMNGVLWFTELCCVWYVLGLGNMEKCSITIIMGNLTRY